MMGVCAVLYYISFFAAARLLGVSTFFFYIAGTIVLSRFVIIYRGRAQYIYIYIYVCVFCRENRAKRPALSKTVVSVVVADLEQHRVNYY